MSTFTDNWIDARREEIVSALQRLISYESVSGPAAGENAPFGEECRGALDYALSLCRQQGFEAVDMQGYIGYGEYGAGEEALGILTHLDVVPAGEGWSSPPYEGRIVDGRLVGRGALDDKGPAISAIFALAAVKAEGLSFKRRVRLLFGCDEESGMGCMKHYLAHGELPDMAFSPDSMYPLVNSEKNIFQADYRLSYASKVRAKGGTVVNAVPGGAEAELPLSPEQVRRYVKEDWYTLTPCGEGCRVQARGRAAHASMPEQGENAIQRLLALLARLPLPAEDAAAAKALWGAFGLEYYGESLGLDMQDASGRLTLNLGRMEWDESGVKIGLDIRAPMMLDEAGILARLNAALAPAGFELIRSSFSPGFCLDEDCELVRTLLSVYRGRTGDMAPPKRMGGGTYARHLKNAVSFGPERDGGENLIHMANESIPVEDLIENTKLIADAIAALACGRQ